MRMLPYLSIAVVALSTTIVSAGEQTAKAARAGGTPWQQLARIEPPVMNAPAVSLNAAAIETCTSNRGCFIPERLPAPAAAVATVQPVVPTLEPVSYQPPSKKDLLGKLLNGR